MSSELTVIQPSNAAMYRASTDAAGLCRDIVIATAQNIQGRKYVRAEGWQAIAIAHGCVASAEGVERIQDEGFGGYRAFGVIRRMSDGAEIARAEGFVGDDETMWAKRPVYARRAMAQTRAISRACRSAFAHVVVLIDKNLSTTPAEEVPEGGFHDAHYEEAPRDSRPAQRAAPAPAPAKTADPAIASLSQRADKVVTVLEQCQTTDQMRKHYTNASKVLADLDATDPDRLEAINKLYARRFKELADRELEAEERGAA